MTVFRFTALSAAVAFLASCDNMKSSRSNSSDPYASNYGNDGHYNPYPGQTGYASSSTPSYQKPPTPAQPEPPADPYAFSAPKKTTPSTSSSSSSDVKKVTSSSSSSKKKTTPSKSTAKKSSSGSRYTVAKGDTLYGIARKKGTTVAKLKSANGISGDLIRPGQSLKIP